MSVTEYWPHRELMQRVLDGLDCDAERTTSELLKRDWRLPLTVDLILFHLEHQRSHGADVSSRLRPADGVRVYRKVRRNKEAE